jgi:hypothetical protein
MNLDKIVRWAGHFLSFIAFTLLVLALAERVGNYFGGSFLRGSGYKAGRLFEFAAMFCVFLVAILLREVREELKTQRIDWHKPQSQGEDLGVNRPSFKAAAHG